MMGGGFAWTIPLIQAGFGILFVVAHRAGAPAEARAWAIGYLLSAAGFAASLLDAPVPDAAIAIATDLLFACAFFHFGEAIVRRYGGRELATARRVLFGIAAASPVAAILLTTSVYAELLASDLGSAAQLAVPLAFARRATNRVDGGILLLSWLVVLANVARAVSVPLTAADTSLSSFANSPYSHLMYIDGMLTGVTAGVLALIAVTGDLIGRCRQEAGIDPLTGLLNRRGLNDAVARRHPDGAALVCCDLDHFKRVNDAFGHETGDRVLTAFAELARAALPAGGIAARTGGEEFLLYLPGGTHADARMTAMRLRGAMGRHDWSAQGVPWRLSASFGVAEHRERTGTLADAIVAADGQLYQAKRNGRDQVWGLAAA